jgi:hypothetical protein
MPKKRFHSEEIIHKLRGAKCCRGKAAPLSRSVDSWLSPNGNRRRPPDKGTVPYRLT